MIWFILIAVMILSFIVQSMLQNRFAKYSHEPTSNGMTGADVARKMLQDHGIRDVQVVPTNGRLTDHYNPATKTIALSEEVYASRSIAAAAVAAHECGHAVQHAYAYGPLQMHQRLPYAPMDRYHVVCMHNTIQSDNTSRRNQCEQKSSLLAQQHRNHRFKDKSDGR